MAAGGPIVLIAVKGFAVKYRALAKANPAIKESIKTFNEIKRKIPPEPLPHGMNDHKLKGKHNHFRECHLAPNALLIYNQTGNIITLYDIVGHDAIK